MQKLKKMLFILLLLISVTLFSQTNDQQRQYRIGYTTEYANGQFNSSHFIDNSSSYRSQRRSPSVPDYHDGEWDGWDVLNGDWWRYYITEGSDKFWSQVDWSNPANQNNTSLQDLWKSDHPGQTPPWETPVGDMPWILGGMFIIAYIIRQKRKNDTIAQW